MVLSPAFKGHLDLFVPKPYRCVVPTRRDRNPYPESFRDSVRLAFVLLTTINYRGPKIDFSATMEHNHYI
jgi:hypothetical protein